MKPALTKQDAELIRQRVTDGLLLDALEYAQKYGDEFINLLARFNALNQDSNQHVITREIHQAETNRLRRDFLKTVEEYAIEEDDPPEEEAPETKPLFKLKQLPYLNNLEDHPFAAGFEKFLLMEPEFFSTMNQYKGSKILTYYFLQERQAGFKKAFQQLSMVEPDRNNFDEGLIEILQLLEKHVEQLVKALKKSGNEGVAYFSELERMLKEVHSAKKELARAIIAGNNSSERSRLVDITLPQLEVALEELIYNIGEEIDGITRFSRN